jgi:hypothetical protein
MLKTFTDTVSTAVITRCGIRMGNKHDGEERFAKS